MERPRGNGVAWRGGLWNRTAKGTISGGVFLLCADDDRNPTARSLAEHRALAKTDRPGLAGSRLSPGRSDAGNETAWATSSGRPIRSIGILLVHSLLNRSDVATCMERRNPWSGSAE
jgi:hypothetical protein